MNILLFGASGLIGNAFIEQYYTKYRITAVTRRNINHIKYNKANWLQWNFIDTSIVDAIAKTDVIINLIGENVGSGIWTKAKKEKILYSRIFLPTMLAKIIDENNFKIQHYIQASAIGIYPSNLENAYTDEASAANNFLANVVVKWEKAGEKIKNLNITTTFLRTGIVLDKNEGALHKLALPHKFGIGGYFGKGNQWLSWIHLNDEVRAIDYIIDKKLSGKFNLTAPQPETQKSFNKLLARALNRPFVFPIPEFPIKLIFGEMAKATILSSTKALPKKLLDSGFNFNYTNAEHALTDIYRKN